MFAPANYPSLKDRAVFVTGGGSGIGAALVLAFCEQGSNVGFNDIDTRASLDVVETCRSRTGRTPRFVECDLRDIASLRVSIQTVAAEFGAIRVLVNNAANDERHALESVTPEYWDDRMAVNLRHQFFAAQGVYQAMADAGGGSIINMGSIGWMKANGQMAAYGSAKAGIHGLTKTLARDLGGMNIRVNTVVPGWIMTDRQVKNWLTPDAERELLARQCLKRKLMPEDVARMVLFLAADDSMGCTSQSYLIDAGTV